MFEECENSDEDDNLEEVNSDENNSDKSFELSSDESDYEIAEDVSIEPEKSDQTPGPSERKRRRFIGVSKFDPCDKYGWSEYEGKILLNALKDYGTGHVNAISARIPTKNTNEIKEYLERKRKGAVMHLKAGVSDHNKATIDKWITHLCKLCPTDDYKIQYVARALKYIALFEERSGENGNDDDDKVQGVNLRSCYLILSSLLSGEGPKYTNRVTSYFFHNTIQKFAKYMKQVNTTNEEKYLKCTSKPPVKCYGKKKTPVAAEDPILNPLNLAKDVLKLD